MTSAEVGACWRIIARHGKSFALASRLLSPGVRQDAVVLYAWCRQRDDAIDLVEPEQGARALEAARTELVRIGRGEAPDDPIGRAFASLVSRRQIPQQYPEQLLLGFEMDLARTCYHSFEQLLLYCYRVAGTVGLMMSHVMQVTHPSALRHAAHLGMAMQLTNICRDVLEDWGRQRLYLPQDLLRECGAGDLGGELGRPLPQQAREPLARAVRILLGEAERFYRSGDAGLRYLPWRSALAVRTARELYSAIGKEIARRGHDVFAGRAWVPTRARLGILLRSLGRVPLDWTKRVSRVTPLPPTFKIMRYPGDILPV